jgi:transcriptional regulator with XRE-family HTH domain
MRYKLGNSFGDTLRDLRQTKGISQVMLADLAHVDRTHISLLERGLRVPTLTTVISIAHALEMTAGQLVAKVQIKFMALNPTYR